MAAGELNPNTTKKGKVCLAEVHPDFEYSLALVNEVSKIKGYELLNWVKPEIKCYFVSYLLSAARRHMNAFVRGEDFNVEVDGNNKQITEFQALHVEHAAYNLLMIASLFRAGRTDLDDRRLKP